MSQGSSGVESAAESAVKWIQAEELVWRVRMPVTGDSSDGQIEGRRGTQLKKARTCQIVE